MQLHLTVVVNTVLAFSKLCPSICDQQRSRPKSKHFYWTYFEYVAASYREGEDIFHLSNAKLLYLNIKNRFKSLKKLLYPSTVTNSY